MVQTDNGPEVRTWFHDQLRTKGIALKHSRVKKSNDNAHIERFSRTIQEGVLIPIYLSEEKTRHVIPEHALSTIASSGDILLLTEATDLTYSIGQ